MPKITLDDTVSGYNLQIINNNFDKVEAEFQEKVLYRNNPDGEPNEMENDLDMNGNRIINLPAPISPSEVARLQDVQDAMSEGGTATLTEFTPYKTLSSANVQGAMEELKDEVDVVAADLNDLEEVVDNLVFSAETYTKVSMESTAIDLSVTAIRTVGYYSDGDFGDALYVKVASEPVHPGKVQSADGAWWEIREKELNVLQFGAVPNSTGVGNGTDNKAAFQASLNCALLTGKNLFIPAGGYRLNTPLILDKSTISGDSGFVPNIRGAGPAMTRIFCSSSGFELNGAYTPGIYGAFFELKDIKFDGPSRAVNSIGVHIRASGFVRLTRVMCVNFDTGVRTEGVISSKLDQPWLAANNVGLLCAANIDSSWPPNAITVDQPWIASNQHWGIYLDQPATFNIRGGSVEGNGHAAGLPNEQRGGISVNNPGTGGHASIVSTGVYYEYNSGIADVLLYGSTRNTSASFDGNTFTRLAPGPGERNPVVYCIYATGANHPTVVNITGNGFGELAGGFTPTANEPYVKLEYSNQMYTVHDEGNSYMTDAAFPDYSLVRSVSHGTEPYAMAYIYGNGTLEGQSYNILQAVRESEGVYKFTFARPITGRKFAVCSPAVPTAWCVSTHDANSITIATYDMGYVLQDREFGLVVYTMAKW